MLVLSYDVADTEITQTKSSLKKSGTILRLTSVLGGIIRSIPLLKESPLVSPTFSMGLSYQWNSW